MGGYKGCGRGVGAGSVLPVAMGIAISVQVKPVLTSQSSENPTQKVLTSGGSGGHTLYCRIISLHLMIGVGMMTRGLAVAVAVAVAVTLLTPLTPLTSLTSLTLMVLGVEPTVARAVPVGCNESTLGVVVLKVGHRKLDMVGLLSTPRRGKPMPN